MNAASLGYLFGIVMFMGVLPAVFIAYGRGNKKRWAVIVGSVLIVIMALSIAGQMMMGAAGAAHILPPILWLAAFFVKPKQAIASP